MIHCKNKKWEGIQIFLAGKGFMSVGKGLAWDGDIINGFFVNNMKQHR